MTTQTGIRPDDKLSGFFGQCRTGQYRMLKVVIKAEKLVLESSSEAQGSWERDWDPMILANLEDSSPCFILFRLDEKEGETYRWIMISWSPDSSSIRNKMLYASTKASLKREFGGGQIKDDLYGNVREDVSLEGYRKHLISAAAPGPLSREEIEREEVKQAQNDVAVGVDTKHNTMGGGIHFPMTSAVTSALGELKSRRLDYIQMSVDTKAEIINLEEKGSCPVEGLPKKVPENAPRYHLFLFKHTHEGDSLASVVFMLIAQPSSGQLAVAEQSATVVSQSRRRPASLNLKASLNHPKGSIPAARRPFRQGPPSQCLRLTASDLRYQPCQ